MTATDEREALAAFEERMSDPQTPARSRLLFDYWWDAAGGGSSYEAARAAYAAAREQAIEECAKVCEEEAVTPDNPPDPTDVSYNNAISHVARAIRALLTSGAR